MADDPLPADLYRNLRLALAELEEPLQTPGRPPRYVPGLVGGKANAMRYERPGPIGRSEALDAIASGDSARSSDAIIRLALNDPDGHWVEEVALGLMDSNDPNVRAVAATALGHIARIHRKISTDRVLPALRGLLEDPRTAGRAEDALSDIAIFIPDAEGSL